MTSPVALRPGDQLASTVCSTRVVVIRAPAERQPLIACGGSPMAVFAPGGRPPGDPPPGGTHPPRPPLVTLIGKRYVDAAETVELLCTSSGAGELRCDGAPMTVKAAKPLPASD
jgi:hypothetical protein